VNESHPISDESGKTRKGRTLSSQRPFVVTSLLAAI
jgi:hypothetical protein